MDFQTLNPIWILGMKSTWLIQLAGFNLLIFYKRCLFLCLYKYWSVLFFFLDIYFRIVISAMLASNERKHVPFSIFWTQVVQDWCYFFLKELINLTTEAIWAWNYLCGHFVEQNSIPWIVKRYSDFKSSSCFSSGRLYLSKKF